MARTRTEVNFVMKTANENEYDNSTTQLFDETLINVNENQTNINYQGVVQDLPSFKQLKDFAIKTFYVYREFCLTKKLQSVYYATILSPFLVILLLLTGSDYFNFSSLSSSSSSTTAFDVNIDEANNSLNMYLFSFNDTLLTNNELSNANEIITKISEINYKLLRIDEKLKDYQSPNELNYQIRSIVNEYIQNYEKNREIEANLHSAEISQKLSLLKQKIINLEINFKKLSHDLVNIYFENGNHKNRKLKYQNSNMNPLNIHLNNLNTEIQSLKQYCNENSKYQEYSSQKAYKKYLQDFKYWIETNFVTKVEFIKLFNQKFNNTNSNSFWRNFILYQSNNVNDANINAPHVTNIDQIKELIKQAIYIYNADKTGMTDFALESAGALVLTHRCSKSYSKQMPKARLFGIIPIPYYTNSPRIAIQSQVLPGDCWAFEGSKGKLVIKLSTSIIPTSFSVEHIPIVLSPNGKIDSAMRDFSVYGYENEYSKEAVLMGTYHYEANSPEYLQYFPVQIELNNVFQIIEFKIDSNHGHKQYTCIYRVRVHGVLPH